MDHAGHVAELKLAEEFVEDLEVLMDVFRVVRCRRKALRRIQTFYFLFSFKPNFSSFHFPSWGGGPNWGFINHNKENSQSTICWDQRLQITNLNASTNTEVLQKYKYKYICLDKWLQIHNFECIHNSIAQKPQISLNVQRCYIRSCVIIAATQIMDQRSDWQYLLSEVAANPLEGFRDGFGKGTHLFWLKLLVGKICTGKKIYWILTGLYCFV